MTARIQAYGTPAYRQLWRVVDGAVRDCFAMHPDYLTPNGRRSARGSINKRVVGACLSYAAAAAKARSGSSPAGETGSDAAYVACGSLHIRATTRAGRVLLALRTILTLGAL